MNRTFIAGVILGAALVGGGVAAIITIDNDAAAAPFNRTTTERADLAVVDRVCFNRTRLADGGTPADGGVFVDSFLSIPVQKALPGGGFDTTMDLAVGRYEENRPAQRNAILNYMENGALTGGRTAAGLEQ